MSYSLNSQESESSRPILLVHGGMHGSWCWRRVIPILVSAGHRVVAPTLTGLGHRAHLGGAEIGLTDHIQDVAACIEAEELDDFVLVGHSYAGMVITGVADRLAERIAELVYLDALVPDDGEAACDLVPRGVDYASLPDGMLPPLLNYDFGLTDPDDIAWVQRRITPQSARTVTEPIQLKGEVDRIRRTFIECVGEREGSAQMQHIAKRAQRLSGAPGWTHLTLAAGHDCMISHPIETAALLLEVAKRFPLTAAKDRA